MAQTVFPSSPTLNQIFTVLGRDWKWNGYAWDLLGDGGVNYTRRSDYVELTYTSYEGFALVGSSEIAEVWTITKIVADAGGSIVSVVQTENVAWSDRYTL